MSRRWGMVGRSIAIALSVAAGAACAGGTERHGPDRSASTTEAPGSAPAGAEPAGAVETAGDGPHVVRATRLATMPALVTSLTAVPDGSELLVGDRTGVVRRFTRTEVDGYTVPILEEQPVLDVSDRVSLQFDRGFLGMTLVDGGSSLVVMFTGPAGESTLEQYDYESGQPVDVSTKRSLWVLPWPYPWHHGGGMAVAPDGDLFIGLGDKGLSLPGVPASQDPTLLLGGVLRIPAEVLADRSATWQPQPSAMVARGFRNPWRLSLDPDTGDLWIGEVGDLESEELNRVRGADLGARVLNFGYPYYEGSTPRHERIPSDIEFEGPTVERLRSKDDACGMVGGFRYRGTLVPELSGRLLYSDLCSTELRALTFDDEGEVIGDDPVGELPETIVSFAEGSTGELYALGYLGGVFRIDAASWSVADRDQQPPPPTTATTTTVVPDTKCGVAEAIEPLGFLNGLSPDRLRQHLETADAALTRDVPNLPPEVLEPGRVIQRTVRGLTELYASIGWDAESPDLAGLRSDMIDAEGLFDGFPDAIAAFFGTRCI